MFNLFAFISKFFTAACKFFVNELPRPIVYTLLAIVAMVVVFNAGKSVGRAEVNTQIELNQIRAKYAIQEKQKDVSNTIDRISYALSKNYTQLNDKKDTLYEHIDQAQQSVLSKHTADRVQFDTANTPYASGYRFATPVSAPTKTILVTVPSVWGFSKDDRQFLIKEAARADRVDAQLKLCKQALDNVYQTHDQYQQEVARYYQKMKETR